MEKLLQSPFLNPAYRMNVGQFRQITKENRIKRFTGPWREKLKEYETIDSEIINEFIEKISTICKIVSHLDTAGRLSELPGICLETLDRLGMLRWFERDDNHLSRFNKEREFRAYNRFYKLLNQLGQMKTFNEISLPEFYSLLQMIIRDATYSLKEWSNYGVQVMPRLEIQSIESEILFVGGLVEGEFPRGIKSDIFFDDNERDHLGLYAVEDLLAQDRFIFFQLLSVPVKHTFLLFPENEDDTVLLPSSFIRSFREITAVDIYSEQIDAEKLVNRSNAAEFLTRLIKTGLPDNELQNYSAWSAVIKEKEKQYIAQTIRSTYQKYSRTGFKAWEGNLASNVQILDYLGKRNDTGLFSITALELYAFCPMKYFLQRLLHLPDDEEEDEEIFNAMERGSLLHKILFEFYSQLKARNQHNQPWMHDQLLQDIAHRYLDQLPYEGVIWLLEKEKILGNNDQKGLLRRFLEIEQEAIVSGTYRPEFFEFGFGLSRDRDESDDRSVSSPLQLKQGDKKIRVSGKIDRIDIDAAGNALVIDYKSGKGKNAAIKDMYAGTSLQLPVYMAAVEKLLKTYTPAGGLYYQVHDALHCQRLPAVSDLEKAPELIRRGHGKLPNKNYSITLKELIDISIQHMFKHLENMSRGNFNHTSEPEDEGCQTYCTFRRICRKDVGKLKSIAEKESN
jgi:ATP-dependent helicase/DNAse subunit B